MHVIQHEVVLCCGAKVVCYAKCVRIWKIFPRFAGVQRKWLFVSFMHHKDNKGKCATSIVYESGKHYQNSLSAGGNVFLV